MDEKNIISGEPIVKTIDSSIGEILFTILKAYDEDILQIDAETDEKQTAIIILNKAIVLAKWLRSKGVAIGVPVSIFSENRLEYIVYLVACFLIGASIAPLNPEYTSSELQHVINLSKPKIVFCTPTTIEKLLEILPQNQYIKDIVLFGRKSSRYNNFFYYNDITKGVSKNYDNSTFQPTALNPEETVAAILTSSGTTGLPKGVMITHSNITTYMDIAKTLVGDFEIGEQNLGKTVSVIPFFHSFGFFMLLFNLVRGTTSIVMKKFKLQLFLELIQKYKVDSLFVPPPILVLLSKHPLVKKYNLSSLREIRCGAAPLGKDIEHEIENKYNIYVSQGYGMTETTLGVLTNRHKQKKPGSVGKIVPGMKCKVINEKGEALGPYEKGELCFKGPLIMKGYIGDDAATKVTIDDDNWLHSGDEGYYDEDGYFYIVDRIKELIKYKGYQVAPAELEAVLLSHEKVADAAVIGVPDNTAGELPKAFIVKKPKTRVTAEELQKYVASKVSSPKWLRGGIEFITEIPKNPSGKILRRELRERNKKLVSKL